ncbi:MAG TPA: pyrroline-5-carboxylate reductase [Woeseiaceae bacterium]|nr:pyrroline-5-carboxylate reductase [Woeseiaceae bacterium]
MAGSRIGFIGGGNMARAIAGGLVRSGYGAHNLLIAEPRPEQRAQLALELPGATVTADNDAVASAADNLLLAVKPQILREVCTGIRAAVQKSRPLVISIAAGPAVDDIDGWLGGGLEIVRAMPNQPALVDRGIAALYANPRTGQAGRELAGKVLAAVGSVVWVEDESLLDAVTAVSGTGPAYVYLLIDMMIEAAVAFGIPPDVARRLAIETACGAAELARTGEEPMTALIERVRSPGGTTTAAFEQLEAHDVRGIFARAIAAARDRARELAAEARATTPTDPS